MDWENIRKEYESSSVTLKELAEKHDIKLGTLKSRKSREGWFRDAPKKDATKAKKVATQKRKAASSKPVIESEELNDNQKRFCLEYIKYFNATKAYQKAYGCSYNTANAEGYKLLVNPCIKKEIEHLKNRQQQGLFLEGKDVLQKYIDIAFADITDFVEFGRRESVSIDSETNKEVTDAIDYVDIKESSDVDGTLITEVKNGKEGISIKLADKMKALEKLEKYVDLLPDHHKRKLEEEKSILDNKKYELDKRIVEMREREEQTKGW